MEWKEVRLGDFMQCNPKRTIKKGQKARKITMDLLIPHSKTIRNWNYEPYSGGAKFQNGDTIMARITPCLENGKHAFVSILDEGEIAYGSTEYFVFCGKEKVSDNDFVYYLTQTPLFRDTAIKSMVGSSGRQRAQMDVLENLKMFVPKDISDQRRIASILSSLDRKIELNNKINADLEEMAQAIFKNWFVDFEPFKDGKFVDSELGMIPEGWKVGTLKDLLYLRKDSIKAANKGNLPYLPIDTIPMHCLVATDFKSNDEAKSSLQTFEQNDIVVGAMRVYFHRVILAPCKGITRTTCFVLSVKNENALAYSLMQCNQDEAISFAEKTSKGSTMPYAVWDGGYGEYKVVIPPSEVMKSFNDLLSNFFSKMNKNAIENSRLSLLRDTLLPRLMSGELEVPE